MSPTEKIDFPLLPEPQWLEREGLVFYPDDPAIRDDSFTVMFTAQQMRDYVAADRAQRQAGQTLYVCARECVSCGHTGINDDSDTQSACNDCDWAGDTPAQDQCPGCGQDGTMSAACPKCAARYRLLAEVDLPIEAQRQAGQEPVALVDSGTLFWNIPTPTYSVPPHLLQGQHWLYTAPPAMPVPEGYEAIAVKGLGPLIDALERAENKGYLPDAVANEWAAFDYRAF